MDTLWNVHPELCKTFSCVLFEIFIQPNLDAIKDQTGKWEIDLNLNNHYFFYLFSSPWHAFTKERKENQRKDLINLIVFFASFLFDFIIPPNTPNAQFTLNPLLLTAPGEMNLHYIRVNLYRERKCVHFKYKIKITEKNKANQK